MKLRKIIIYSLVIIGIVLLVNQPTFAEVGNSGGFGGGSSGGSSGGGFGGFGGGGGFFLFGGSPIVLIVIIAFIAIRYFAQSKNGGNNTGNSQSRFNTSYIDEAGVVEKIKENDPDFSAQRFKSYTGEVYMALQDAWEAKDWKSVRAFESNALFSMHSRQLEEYITKHKTNHLDQQDVRLVTIASYHVDGNQEVLSVRLNASLLDYTTDDATGKILDGSDKTLQERSYRLEFIRTLGVKTSVEEGLNTTNCPNCGAPTLVTSSGECEYCHSVITNGEYGWVLNKYGAWQ